jgi:transposase
MAKRDDVPKTDPSEIEALIQRLKQSNLEPRDTQLVERLLRLVLSMASLLQHKNASIKRLKRLIFGPSSDKRAVTGSSTEEGAAVPSKDSEQQPGSDSSPVTTKSSSSDQKPKRSGHGRMAASAYTGAKVVICRHPSVKTGDHCPDPLCGGHLYPVSSPAIFIQLTGQPLVGATRYEQEVLRCSACLERFTAPTPSREMQQWSVIGEGTVRYGRALLWSIVWYFASQVGRMLGEARSTEPFAQDSLLSAQSVG